MSAPDNDRPVLEELINLERELHRAETRRNRKRMEALLHPDFIEFGRSGTRYSRTDVLEEYGPDSTLPAIHSESFDLVRLSERIALLTYSSAHMDVHGNAHRHTLRSSIWMLTGVGWQMRFHQGTPTSGAVPAP